MTNGANLVPGEAEAGLKGLALDSTTHCRSQRFSPAAVAAFEHYYQSGQWMKDAGGKPHEIDAATRAIAGEDPSYYWLPFEKRHSLSGGGSDRGDVTRRVGAFLSRVMERHRVQTMIDVPCGDVNWQMDNWRIDAAAAYVGLDIVKALVTFNQKRFRHHSNKLFALWDFAACPLPRIALGPAYARNESVPADLLHVKDVLGHMPLARATAAVRHIAESGVRLVVTPTFNKSNFPATGNKQVREGHHYYVDVRSPPFHFPEPTECITPISSTKLTVHFCLFVIDGEVRKKWLARLRSAGALSAHRL